MAGKRDVSGPTLRYLVELPADPPTVLLTARWDGRPVLVGGLRVRMPEVVA